MNYAVLLNLILRKATDPHLTPSYPNPPTPTQKPLTSN